MDDRIYFHQYRRPRNSNPTYMSTSVQNSMTFFNGGSFPEPKRYQQPANLINRSQNTYTKEANLVPSSPIDQYRPKQEIRSSPIYYPQRNQQRPSNATQTQQNSKLSNYGERSLKLDQRGVYNKQSSKFDIINLKPKQYNSDIKQYPWFSIENRDDVYYRRMNDIYNGSNNQRARTFEKPIGNPAGKYTYGIEPKIALDPEIYQHTQRFTPKMLNHMDQLQHSLA